MNKSSTSPGRLLNVNEVAELAGVSPKTIRRAKNRLEISVTRIGKCVRISEAAYGDWVRRNTRDANL